LTVLIVFINVIAPDISILGVLFYGQSQRNILKKIKKDLFVLKKELHLLNNHN